jgi:hypothetical protein
MESKIVVKLDRHEARKTDASTRWFLKSSGKTYELEEAEKQGLVKRIYSTHACNKTHWDEYFEVINPSVTFIRIRVSNRGNVSTFEYPPEMLKAPSEEVESIRLLTGTSRSGGIRNE